MKKEKVIQNAVANRIVQTLYVNGEMTTMEMQRSIEDVSQATIYRYVKLLEEYGFLRVSKEEKICGQIERTYCIGDISISESDSSEDAMKSVDLFLKKIRSEYDIYFAKGNLPREDKLFISQTSLTLSDEEYDDLCLEIKGVLNKYIAREKTAVRKNRNLYIITTPGKESL